MTITDVTIKTPDRKCDRGPKWRHARNRWERILEFEKNSQGYPPISSTCYLYRWISYFDSSARGQYVTHWTNPGSNLPQKSNCKTTRIRWTRHAGLYWRRKDEHISDVLPWTPSHGRECFGRPTRTYLVSSVRTQDVIEKTCRKRWIIRTDGVRESGKYVLAAWHDDPDDKIHIDLRFVSETCLLECVLLLQCVLVSKNLAEYIPLQIY